ncbi:sulfoxide reductase heme-binding subunit YedZ [Woeseiaceae bacterium]|jgi:methionine sulfoxide reductase heme-binding subunit|nr:sulfoxide reductase heme-binding subunit YedZ [Woeseiaceae bacterium]|tara:strand:- start:110 stop:715 length:606 start_codon:yes stop_codon:yes gene_type:complete
MLSSRTARKFLKPPVFLICSLPFFLIFTDAFELTGNLGANPIEEIQDRLGNWGLRFLLLTLMISPLRQITGQIWLTLFRRMLGLFTFFYILMHFFTWLILEQSLYIPAITEDIITRPFITIGFLALLILLLLTITSTNKMQRKLQKKWHKIHRLVYSASILAVWHYWWQVKKDITEPLIYVVILSILLSYRIWIKYLQKNK